MYRSTLCSYFHIILLNIMKYLSNFIGIVNIILGILNICKFLYYAGHYYNFLYINLIVGIFCIIIGKNLLKS